jgi:hypothetical protein
MAKNYMEAVRSHMKDKSRNGTWKRKTIQDNLIDELGGMEAYTKYRDAYENEKLSDMLLNRNAVNKVVVKNQHLVRKYEPIYKEASSRIGRAHLYAPVKFIGKIGIDTIWFNLLFIWFTIFILYLTLYFDLLRKVITYFENVKLRKQR